MSAPLNAAGFALGLSEVPAERLKKHVPAASLETREEKLTRIFQIGFNKCGTRSLYRFLQRAGIASAHFNRGRLAVAMKANIEAGLKPLTGEIDRYVAYTDVQQVSRHEAIEGVRYFRELYQYYPRSYFILNTRDRDGWIRSRLNHGNGFYARRYARALRLPDEAAVVAHWTAEWDSHLAEVQAFFADKPGRLIVYDIKTDAPQKLVDFLAPDFLTRADDFRHEGETASVDVAKYRGRRGGDSVEAGDRRGNRRAAKP
jgi:Sulfotransferase domain